MYWSECVARSVSKGECVGVSVEGCVLEGICWKKSIGVILLEGVC